MSMERNHDWKGPVALVLAGLALFIALGGRNAFDFSPGPGNVTVYLEPQRVGPFPQMPQTFPVAPTVVPAMPDSRLFDQRGFGVVTYDGQDGHGWGGWHRWFGGMPPILPIILALALVFFGWRLLSQNRHRIGYMQQAPAPPPYPNPNPGPGASPPPGPPYYGDINQRQSDS